MSTLSCLMHWVFALAVCLPVTNAKAYQEVISEKGHFLLYAENGSYVYQRCLEKASSGSTLEQAKKSCGTQVTRKYTNDEFATRLSKCTDRLARKMELPGFTVSEKFYLWELEDGEQKLEKLAQEKCGVSDPLSCPALSSTERLQYKTALSDEQRYESAAHYKIFSAEKALRRADVESKLKLLNPIKSKIESASLYSPNSLSGYSLKLLECAVNADSLEYDFFYSLKNEPESFQFGCCKVEVTARNQPSADSIGNYLEYDQYQMLDCSGHPVIGGKSSLTSKRGGALYLKDNFEYPSLIRYNVQVNGLSAEEVHAALNACLQ